MQTLRCDNCKKVEENSTPLLFGWLKLEAIGPQVINRQNEAHFCSTLCATEYLVQSDDHRLIVGALTLQSGPTA